MTITFSGSSVNRHSGFTTYSGPDRGSNYNDDRDFVPVTRVEPCVVCGKPDWCSRSADGVFAICRRQGSPDQMKTGRDGQPYWVHRIGEEDDVCCSHDSAGEHSAPKKKRSKLPPEARDQFYRRQLENAYRQPDYLPQLVRLARRLDVRADALEAMGCCFNLRTMPPHCRGQWIFPEWDADGHIIGLSTRKANGDDPKDDDKKFIKGGERGVYLPEGWHERAEQTGVVYAVEGASGTAAYWSAGLCAVGRPSNCGGAPYLAQLFKTLPAHIRVVVVADRDQKSDGRWPGRDGAISTARQFAEARGSVVSVVLPPEGCKDGRVWFNRHVKSSSPKEDWLAAGKQFEAGMETLDLIAPPEDPFTNVDSWIPPPSAEELAQRAAQAEAARQAIPVLHKINAGCDRLRKGEGLSRAFGCGCGDPQTLQGIEHPGDFMCSPHFCGELGCECCEAYHRQRHILHAVQVMLRDIPDGGVLPPHLHGREVKPRDVPDGGVPMPPPKQTDPLKLPWRTKSLYVFRCPDAAWKAAKRQINRASRKVGCAGMDALSEPGWTYRKRRADRTRLVMTEAPLESFVYRTKKGERIEIKVETKPAADVTLLLAEEAGLTPRLPYPRRRGDIWFGGRWTKLKAKARYRTVESQVSLAQFTELAYQYGAETVLPIHVDGLAPGRFARFADPAEVALNVAENGGDPVAAEIKAERLIEMFLAALLAGVGTFARTTESDACKSDNGAEGAYTEPSEAEKRRHEEAVAAFL